MDYFKAVMRVCTKALPFQTLRPGLCNLRWSLGMVKSNRVRILPVVLSVFGLPINTILLRNEKLLFSRSSLYTFFLFQTLGICLLFS